MKTRIFVLTAALAAVIATGCGSGDDTKTAGGSGTDRAFVAGMVSHHRSAVEMATIAQRRGTAPFVKTLAANIIRTQNEEISAMQAEDAKLAQSGVDTGDLGVDHSMMGMGMDTASLNTANPFDPAFLKMMLPHHEAALVMAKAEIEDGSDPELKAIARQIIAGQTKEIAQMKQHLAAG